MYVLFVEIMKLIFSLSWPSWVHLIIYNWSEQIVCTALMCCRHYSTFFFFLGGCAESTDNGAQGPPLAPAEFGIIGVLNIRFIAEKRVGGIVYIVLFMLVGGQVTMSA